MSNRYDTIIVGGGASGYFTAINIKEQNEAHSCLILEQTKHTLSKVRISGGGRCNVTNSITEVKELAQNYPRGNVELVGPFHSFTSSDTVSWFEDRGVYLHTEEDGRMFPQSNSSEEIIDLFNELCSVYKIPTHLNQKVKKISFSDDQWTITTDTNTYICTNLVIASGASPYMWNLLERDLQIKTIPPVPSLFTFKLKPNALKDLQGLSVTTAEVKIASAKVLTSGPLLITHEGVSGPAVLKSSAWGARWMADQGYQFEVKVNWVSSLTIDTLKKLRTSQNKKLLTNGFEYLPKRLWHRLLEFTTLPSNTTWAMLSNAQLDDLLAVIQSFTLSVQGKSTFKDEFVTAGGVDLKEVNFKDFSIKKYKGLYCVGEVLNIDAVTGGFNFQNCWTGGYLAARSIAK